MLILDMQSNGKVKFHLFKYCKLMVSFGKFCSTGLWSIHSIQVDLVVLNDKKLKHKK